MCRWLLYLSCVMSAFDLYFIKSVLFVLMAVNMDGFVNDCFIVASVFASEVFAFRAVNLPGIFACVFDLFFPYFLVLPVTNCHSSVSPSSDDDSGDSEGGS